MVNSVINRKERFATEGIRFQRHNGDGTIATPQRFLGFANKTDLSNVLKDKKAQLTIKIDGAPSVTKNVTFDIDDLSNVTVQEAAEALNKAKFPNIEFGIDAKTERLKGCYANGTKAEIIIGLTNETEESITIPANIYTMTINENDFICIVESDIELNEAESESLTFIANIIGELTELPLVHAEVNLASITPNVNEDLTAEFEAVTNGTGTNLNGKIVQVLGRLAAALDFGNCLKHGGNGLEVISFFDDDTISIGLPKNIKDKEEIDIEGAKGTITRMIIGAMIQGISPVFTTKVKDYYLLELIQGGKLDRETGIYNPPLSHESEHPTFWGEMFSPIYSKGSSKASDVAGYERLLLRTMMGMEGDVPAEAKAWAQYAYNLVATEYTDENDKKYPAWEEQTITASQFDGLNVKGISEK